MYEYTWVKPGDQRSISDVVDVVMTVSESDPFIGFSTDPGADAAGALEKKLTDGLNSGQMHLLLINHDVDQAIGCVALNQLFSFQNRHIADLAIGAVRPTHRGRGVVTSAFREIVRRCAGLGVEHLRLEVHEDVPAEKLWRNYGFEEYGRFVDYARVDGDSYTGIYLAQSVDQLNANILDRSIPAAGPE